MFSFFHVFLPSLFLTEPPAEKGLKETNTRSEEGGREGGGVTYCPLEAMGRTVPPLLISVLYYCCIIFG